MALKNLNKLQEVAMKRLLLIFGLLALLVTPLVPVSADSDVITIGARVGGGREYGHPIYDWNQNVLMDILYRPSVGYDYIEIEAAFYAIAATPCGQPGQRECWYGSHVGILKNTVSDPPVVAGLYHNEWDGKYYLIDTGQCLLKDGCLDE
ncbi:hypothetical protein A2572_02725 [Candidatus Collierbacteria bacterium RIFOXYD1_FULL_40_9]|uniref:Uncharacterized protein n=1 Tax=Candidatus Collierbacteria bacterium RIFOXYD1_FULL_40_9 TaxID=1817731 RepID=A0A1F5FW67_9BACT|nr:MAG: hypothetical protein A2572_02725 [Candidatus Collierbacteria bacterium RIFOXYD1_FULL_40_9]